ncbi:MAG: hypothetical protein U0572_02925 [Phycisphaerales bacterium]
MESFVVGFFTGLVGLGYFMYGKREGKFSAILSGVLLSVYPFFLSNMIALVLVGVAFAAIPFFVDF